MPQSTYSNHTPFEHGQQTSAGKDFPFCIAHLGTGRPTYTQVLIGPSLEGLMKSSSRPVLYSLNDRSAATYNDLTGVWRMTAPKYLLCQGAADTNAPSSYTHLCIVSPEKEFYKASETSGVLGVCSGPGIPPLTTPSTHSTRKKSGPVVLAARTREGSKKEERWAPSLSTPCLGLAVS